MLHRTQAVQALRAVCRRERLPEDTALELVRYLQVKRYHDAFLSEVDQTGTMSPSIKLNRLWQLMLLETDISTLVHELVGGVVRYAVTEERQITHSERVLQRLYAMNVMASAGWKPAVRLWQEPNMSPIAITQFADGTELYIISGMSEVHIAALKQDVRHFLTADTSRPGSSNRSAVRTAVPANGAPNPQPAELNQQPPSPVQADDAAEQEAAPANAQDNQALNVYHGLWVHVASTGSCHQVTVSVNHPTAGDIKLAMERLIDAPAPQMRLLVAEFEGPDGPSLHYLTADTDCVAPRVIGSNVLRLYLPGDRRPEAPLNPYSVGVRTLTGQIYDLSGKVAPWMLITEVKTVLQSIAGIPVNHQRLIFLGRHLDDFKMLSEYDVQSGDQMHVAIHPSP